MSFIETDKTVKIRTPLTPNFMEVDGQMLPIDQLSDGQLKAVGEMWTRELIEKARRKRNEISTKTRGSAG